LRPDAGKHERSHRGHTELLICVRLRNKNAKGKAAEKSKKKVLRMQPCRKVFLQIDFS
jgi:hypothetical protein